MKNMKKMFALVLVIALVSFIFAPLSAFAGGRHGGYQGSNHGGYRGHRGHGGISTGAAVGIGLGSLAIGVLIGQATQPAHYPVYGSQPVYFPPMSPMYRSPVCAGTLTEEYGWQPDPRGGPPYYVKTGRTFCSGQILH